MPSDIEIFEQAFKSAVESRRRRLPTFDEVRYNASLMLGNSQISAGDAFSVPQAYKMIGGFHIKEKIEPLPKVIKSNIKEKSFIHVNTSFFLQTHFHSNSVMRHREKT